MTKKNINSNFKKFLDQKVIQFNNSSFIKDDPVCIPHLFSKKQDIEIAGFFAAIFAWGVRKTIINKCWLLLQLMDNAPYDFCLHHSDEDLKELKNFAIAHSMIRTFYILFHSLNFIIQNINL